MIAGVGAIGALLWIAGIVIIALFILALFKPWHALALAVLITLMITVPIFLPFTQYKLASWHAGFDYIERNNIRGNETNFGVIVPGDGSLFEVRPSMPRTLRQKLSFSIEGPDENFPISFSIIATNKTDLSLSFSGCEFAAEPDGLLRVLGVECGAAETSEITYMSPPDAAFLALLRQNRYDEHDRIKYLRAYHDGYLISVSSRALPRADWETHLARVFAIIDANLVVLPN